MAFGLDTINSFGGAASDLLKGDATAQQFRLQGGATAKGLRLGAQATAQSLRLNAEATRDGLRLKAKGDDIEATNYDLAGELAGQNADYTAQSTAISLVQSDRQLYQNIGAQRTAQGGGGGTASGSSLDILRDSASQGALHRAMQSQQGSITEAGFTEQSKAYGNLAGYARFAATTENDMANKAIVNADMMSATAISNAEQEAQMAEANAEANASAAENSGSIGAGFKTAAGIASFFL